MVEIGQLISEEKFYHDFIHVYSIGARDDNRRRIFL